MPLLQERCRKIHLLLETRLDYLPQPRISDNNDLPGPATSSRVPCEHCRGPSCLTCGGHGWRRRRKGDPEWDEYVEDLTERAVAARGTFGLTSRMQEEQRLTTSIARIEAILRAKQGLETRESFSWERRKALYYAKGSYAKVDRWLPELGCELPLAYKAIKLFYDSSLPYGEEGIVYKHRTVGLTWLATHIPGPLHVPPWLVFERSQSKSESVTELAAQGFTPGAIGRRLNIPKRKVKRMLKVAA